MTDWEICWGYILAQFPVLRGPLKALKSPICGLVSNSAVALRKQIIASLLQCQRMKGKERVWGEEEKQTLYDNKTDGNNSHCN